MSTTSAVCGVGAARQAGQAKRAPSLSDIQPDKGHVFDQKSAKFHEDLAAAHRKREEDESE